MYIKINTSGLIEQKSSSTRDMLTLMQREVDGRIETLGHNYLIPELISILPEIVMIVNEEGKLLRLPPNDIATRCLRYNSDYISGDALIFKYGLNEHGEIDLLELTQDESSALYAHLMEVMM